MQGSRTPLTKNEEVPVLNSEKEFNKVSHVKMY